MSVYDFLAPTWGGWGVNSTWGVGGLTAKNTKEKQRTLRYYNYNQHLASFALKLCGLCGKIRTYTEE